MTSRIIHFPKFSLVKGDIEVDISLDRFEKQFARAQFMLDSQVMHDMTPFMPMRDGMLIDTTKIWSAARAGSGKVCAATPPYGRYLYEGVVMVDEETGSAWARKDAKKKTTSKKLTFDTSKNPDATDHWFDAAKKAHGKAWVKEVKKIAGGG